MINYVQNTNNKILKFVATIVLATIKEFLYLLILHLGMWNVLIVLRLCVVLVFNSGNNVYTIYGLVLYN